MTRLLPVLAAALLTLVGVSAAAGASGPVFRVVAAQDASFRVVPDSATALPSADVPNSAGSLLLPPAWLSRRDSPGIPFTTLSSIWRRAGSEYGIPWQVLAAINKIESNFGRNMGPSSAGAIGWMQFMPSTWERWGTDANRDGVSDPWNAEDAIYSAARYLAAAGGRTDLYRGVYAYNHADWYVQDVLELARLYGHGSGFAFSLDRTQVQVESARKEVVRANRKLVAAIRRERALSRSAEAADRRVGRAELLSARLELERRAYTADADRSAAADRVAELRKELGEAQRALEEARTSALTSSFAPGVAGLVGAPVYNGDYVFPVGGGPEHISVGHRHHDYPAADIAAPMGAPVYALADAIVEEAWHLPAGNCGIGLSMHTEDGRSWTYCHLSYLEPAVQPGTALPAGAAVGLVGSTGHSTGPHLHLQLNPATSYPQDEAWFQGFAGRAFSWQDAATPELEGPPVFEVVGDDTAGAVAFTLAR